MGEKKPKPTKHVKTKETNKTNPKSLWIYMAHTSSQKQTHHYPKECVLLPFFPIHSSETQVHPSQLFYTRPFGNPEHEYRNPILTVHIESYFINSLSFFVSFTFCFDIWPKSTLLWNKLENTFLVFLITAKALMYLRIFPKHKKARCQI